jgi:hypothetical protein
MRAAAHPGVRRYIRDFLAVDPDIAVVTKSFEILLAIANALALVCISLAHTEPALFI